MKTPRAEPVAPMPRLAAASKFDIEAFVAGSGRAIAAHGSGVMPVWGPIFRSLDPSDLRVKVRIANLVDYLASIQTK
jgi:hypothetical protein